jgi:hypothetical protein
MSKSISLGAVVQKGGAAPAALEPRKEGSNQGTKEPSFEGTKETSREARKEAIRRRTWEGQDEVIKVNFEVPMRIRTKLNTLKSLGRIKSGKGFVADVLEAALDAEIAKAEEEGFL